MRNYLVIVILTCCFLLIGGCTNLIARFAYNNLHYPVIEYVDDYFTITDAQQKIIEQGLKNLKPWHKKEALPKIALLLQRFKSYSAQDSISIAEIVNLTNEMVTIFNQHVQALAPIASEFLQTLEPYQTTHARDYAKQLNERRYKEVKNNEYKTDLKERIMDRLEVLFGEVTVRQEKLIDEHLKNVNHFRIIQIDQFAHNHKQFFDLLNNLPKNARADQRIKNFIANRLTNPEAYFIENYKFERRQRQKDAYRTAQLFHETLTTDQKNHFTAQINDYLNIIELLMVESE